jgi:peptidoglycan/LPS O-acetylase OafA/YrhL
VSIVQAFSIPATHAISAPCGPADPVRVFGLDLLRAVAVMMVLGCHWTSHFSYWFGIDAPAVAAVADAIGDTGVELFFALSGFLIGRILIGIIGTRPTWGDFGVFMTRRAMRTLPLYFLWLGLLLCVFPPRQDMMSTALLFATLTQNMLGPWPADYYYAVTWSLAIEEWFYLLLGFALILLARRLGGPRALNCCLAVFLLAPLALRLAFQQRGLLVFFRIDEIAYGVLMARLYLDRSWLFRHPWAPLAVGLALVTAALAARLPLPQALVVPLTSNTEVIGCALCLPAALRLVRAVAWFEAPVRWVAGRSYALYLMHMTILVDVAENRLFEPGVLPASVCVVVAILPPFPLAELSYRLLEAPMLRLRPRQGQFSGHPDENRS